MVEKNLNIMTSDVKLSVKTCQTLLHCFSLFPSELIEKLFNCVYFMLLPTAAISYISQDAFLLHTQQRRLFF